MSCQLVAEGDFTISVVDGTSPTPVGITVALWGSASYNPGGWTSEDVRLPGGGYASYAPIRTEEQPTTLTFTARQVGSPGNSTAVPTLTITHTYAASVTYVVVIDVWAENDLAPTRKTLSWASGADQTASDNALEAEILAETGLTATNSTPTIVVAVFAAGTTVKVVSIDTGTGTVTSAAVTVGGGTVAAELTLADIVLQSGQYPRLVSTTGTGSCNTEEKTLTWKLTDGNGRIYSFPKSTVNAGATIGRAGVDWNVTITSRQAFPDLS